MAVNVTDLVAPRGELEANLFPGEDITDASGRLDQYIKEGLTKVGAATDPDEAVKAWAYYRAYRAVYIRMSADPTTASLDDQGSRQFSTSQAERFLALANEKLEAWERMTSTDTEEEGPWMGGGTGAVSNDYVF